MPQALGNFARACCHSLAHGTHAQVSLSSFAYLFSELVQYCQARVSNIGELERRSAGWEREVVHVRRRAGREHAAVALADLLRTSAGAGLWLCCELTGLCRARALAGWTLWATAWAFGCWSWAAFGTGRGGGTCTSSTPCASFTPRCGRACLDTRRGIWSRAIR